MATRRIGILTGGGDCPGLNAVIRGVAKSAIYRHGMEVIGFCDGFLGLIERRYLPLTAERVSGLLTQGGTILGTSNKADPYAHQRNGGGPVDVSGESVKLYHELGLEALVCVGGDGTMTIGSKFADMGLKIVGVPKTIDKDVAGTDTTFGFDSARAMATEAIDRLHTTAEAHHRVMVVEVMGRNAGWLALESGIAGGGDVILIPEMPYSFEKIYAALEERARRGKRFSIMVVSEGAYPEGGQQTYQESIGRPRLGGCSHMIAQRVQQDTGIDCRVTILGHLQRGGSPTPQDRLLATQFAVKAMEMVADGQFNAMAAMRGGIVTAVPLTEVMGKQRVVPPDSPLIAAALAVGSRFGADCGGETPQPKEKRAAAVCA